MNIQALEKELQNLVEKIQKETTALEKGTTYLNYAKSIAENNLSASALLIDSFKEIESSLISLKQRIDTVDFPQYFSQMRGIIEKLEENIGNIKLAMQEAAKNINVSSEQLQDYQQKARQDIKEIAYLTNKLNEAFLNLVNQIQTANQNSNDLMRLWANADIVNNFSSIRFELLNTGKILQDISIKLQFQLENIQKTVEQINLEIKEYNVKNDQNQIEITSKLNNLAANIRYLMTITVISLLVIIAHNFLK